MANEIKMPQLSDTMHSGKILTWLKKEGDTIVRGDVLAEVETDKANLEIESFHAGILLKIFTPAESEAGVGDVIALVGAAGEAIASNNTTTSKKIEPTTVATPEITTNVAEVVAPVVSSTPELAASNKDSHRVMASPLAKKIAESKGLNLETVRGTGPNGRIVKRDLENQNLAAQTITPTEVVKAAPPSQSTTSNKVVSSEDGTLTPLSKMRATIARRMVESVNQSPHFYVSTSIVMDEAIKLRQQLKEESGFEKLSLNHLVIKASAFALSKEPRVNQAYKQDMLYTPTGIHIGIVVGLEDGLMIPVVRDADKLTLKDLVFEANAGIARARAGRPTSQDLLGGTFSISNMGMFDVENFTAIINPGQGAILAVSSTKREPVVEGERIVIKSVMRVTLSVDHRIIDGVMAGNFLNNFKRSLESPALLLL
jgi:pyruvate dehydrogenase E2 component (dihydrolipoamide acetyltransferase)